MTKLPSDQPLFTTAETLHIVEYGLKQVCALLDQGCPLAAMSLASIAARDAATLINVAVTQARLKGMTWQQIAVELAITRQAAQQRFSYLNPPSAD